MNEFPKNRRSIEVYYAVALWWVTKLKIKKVINLRAGSYRKFKEYRIWVSDHHKSRHINVSERLVNYIAWKSESRFNRRIRFFSIANLFHPRLFRARCASFWERNLQTSSFSLADQLSLFYLALVVSDFFREW